MFRVVLLFAAIVCLGCEDPCSNGRCTPPQSPFDDGSDYAIPDSDAWTHQSSGGKEVIASPVMFVNQHTAAETKSGCPCDAPIMTPVHRPVNTRRITPHQAVPATNQPLSLPPIWLNPGETLQHVFPPRVVYRPGPTYRPVADPAARRPQTMPPPDLLHRTATTRHPCCDRNCVSCKCPAGCDCEPKREGAFVCQVCDRPTVGEDWHELWADDDTPLTCVCKSCWRRLTPNQRARELIEYAKGTIKGGLSPIVTAAIKEASAK